MDGKIIGNELALPPVVALVGGAILSMQIVVTHPQLPKGVRDRLAPKFSNFIEAINNELDALDEAGAL